MQPTFVVLADLSAEQRAWFEPLTHHAHVVFGARLADLEQTLAHAVGLFVWGHPPDSFERILGSTPRLRWVHYTGAGVEHLLVPGFVRRRLVLTNSRGAHTSAVAELALALLLALAKGLPARVHAQREHRWTQQLSNGLAGATVVIVGLGSIGSAVARAVRGLGMHVIGVRRTPRPARGVDEVVAFADLEHVLPRARYLVICCPETSETRGLIGERELNLLPRGAYLVNVARGSIVDEAAMIDALRAGQLAGAGLDVFAHEPLPEDSPLWDLPGVLISPHYPNVQGWERETVQRFIDNAQRFLDGQPLRNVVNRQRGY
jgi:phosphoglycerate dehydrogenase-like enzyme